MERLSKEQSKEILSIAKEILRARLDTIETGGYDELLRQVAEYGEAYEAREHLLAPIKARLAAAKKAAEVWRRVRNERDPERSALISEGMRDIEKLEKVRKNAEKAEFARRQKIDALMGHGASREEAERIAGPLQPGLLPEEQELMAKSKSLMDRANAMGQAKADAAAAEHYVAAGWTKGHGVLPETNVDHEQDSQGG